MNKKRICIAASALALGLMSGVSASAAETINFWFPTFASADGEVTDEEFWNGVMEKFEEENDCEVNVTIVPWDNYEEKYMTGTMATDGPDVGYLYMEMFYDYIDNGMLTDIDSYFTDEQKENYIYYDLGNLLGGQYALPVVVGNPRILVANMDILNEAGITEVPKTLDELVEACEKIKESNPDVAPFMQDWGNAHYGSLNEIYWPFFWSEGGQIVDDEGNLTIDSAEGLAATEFIYSLKEKGILDDTCTACDDTIEPFKNGEVAMTFMASSNALRVDTVNWDYSAVLSGSKDAQTFVAADCLVMFDTCENKDLAAKLMAYATSAEVMSQFHKQVSEQPPITLDEEYEGDERFATLFTEYGDNFKSLPVFKSASSMYDQLFKNLQMMMLDQKTPQEVLTETTEYYNSNLS
ncbi:MAG: sugar ABC transporter substrate-binding protein [Eubacteriales bacterium]|nr:sugar ABC transporter substrate-binding protein [Eubacteriales bacterium]